MRTSIAGSDASDRVRERHRRVALSALASALARGLSLGVSLVSIPLAVRYLGDERFGLWATVTAIGALFAFADLGLGSGLVNALAEATGKDDDDAVASYVSSAFFFSAAVALVFGAVFVVAYPLVDWGTLFKLSPGAADEAGRAVAVFVALFLVTIPASLAQRVHMGLQEGFLASVWTGLGSILGLAGMLLAIALDAGLVWLVAAFAAGPLLGAIANSIVLFGISRPAIRPRMRHVTRSATGKVFGIGVLFFALTVAGALGYQSDSFVIARILGAERVTEYAVPMRLFFIAPTVLSFLLAPLWPAYGEAFARGELDWVKRTFKRSIKLGLAINVPIAAVLILAGPEILRAWVGSEVNVTTSVLVAFGLWAALNGLNGPIAMFLNGANVIRFQVICALAMGVANLVLSIVLVRSIGVAGAVFASAIAQAVFILIPSVLLIHRMLQRLEVPTFDGRAT